MNRHPAHAVPFPELLAGLHAAVDARHVVARPDGRGLTLYCYTGAAVYDRVWTPWTLAARGLVLDEARGRIVATPFPKFFNLGERDDPVPALPFHVYDKLDGSLIVIFHDGSRWRCATKGSFASDQARIAEAMLEPSALTPGVTYLAELIGPSNRIVARYPSDKLVMLGAYGPDGYERDDWREVPGWESAPVRQFASILDIADRARALPMDEEGFVVRFSNGYRLKIKGDEYRRIHAMICRLSPLTVWEAMQADDDLEAFRRELPEEFWADFDAIRDTLCRMLDGIVTTARDAATARSGWTDKEVGLGLKDIPEPARHLVFPYRKTGGDLLGDPMARRSVFKLIRPDANKLDGYTPSYALNRTQAELAS